MSVFHYLLLLLVFSASYLLNKLKNHVFSYWSRRGFPCLAAQIPWGCLRPVAIAQTLSFGEHIRNIHLSHPKVPYLGIYFLFRPALLIRDPVLVKQILSTDFDHFADRGVYYNDETDPIAANLFTMPVKKWRDARNKLSPTFTGGKLKAMFPLVLQKTQQFHQILQDTLTRSNSVHLKDMVAHCNINTLASVFFGFELNAHANPNHEFVTMGKLLFESETLQQKITNMGLFLFPGFIRFLKFPALAKEVSNAALHLVEVATKLRNSEPLETRNKRNDFIQTIMQLMDEKSEDNPWTLEMGTAQAYLFYAAGYETSASTATFCLYELSKNPEWLEKVREEVDNLMGTREGSELQYEDLAELKVLDLCLKETMRMYPALPLLNRECTKEYRIPGTDHVIEKGTPIIISNFGLQREDKYYPDPDKFDPSRFEGKDPGLESRPFYPFGGGPRYCLGKLVKCKYVCGRLI